MVEGFLFGVGFSVGSVVTLLAGMKLLWAIQLIGDRR